MQTNALRVAAYFLIAHFVVVGAVSFLGKGTPDFMRIAITLVLLFGSVAALFKPRKLGWLMVVAYGVYVLNPSLANVWVMWMSPDLPSSTRIAALIGIALIHSPFIVAVVLIFKPGSFASFKTPPPGDVVKQDSSSKS